MIYLTKYNIDLSKYGIDLSNYCECDKQYANVKHCTICHKKQMSIVEYIEHLETIIQQPLSGSQGSPKVCPDCRGSGQDDPPPGKYHGLCQTCNGTGQTFR